MFSSVPARSVGYYLSGSSGDPLKYYWGDKQGVWWTPNDAPASALARFAGCSDGAPIDNDEFIRLAAGSLPDGTTVVRGGSGVRMPGYDCHFAPGKSVSVIFAFSNEAIRRQLVELHVQAVRRALQFLFDWGLIGARRGSAGKDREKVLALVAAIFTEFTSRDNDPQLHSHAFIPNIAVRADGSLGAVDNFCAQVFQLLVGAIYQAQLAHGLVKMGFSVEQRGHAFEVVGVPKQLIRLFSKRRRAIERAAMAMGVNPSLNRAAADVIALDTRSAKSADLTPDQLEIRWLKELDDAGFTASSVPVPDVAPKQAVSTPNRQVDEAISEVFETNAVASKAKLFALVSEKLIGHCDGDGVEHFLMTVVPKKVVALAENKPTGNTQYSTSDIVEMERELLQLARLGRKMREFVPENLIQAAIAARPTLSQEQCDAVRHALNSDQISITEGSAGSGKSFKLSAVAEASRAAGMEIWALGPSWSSAQVLALDTQTPDDRKRALAGFLNDVEAGRIQLKEQNVILLDEGGLAGTRDFFRLVNSVHQAGCKLVISGDTMQLSPVSAGSPMRLLARLLGTSRMLEIRRQKLPWCRAASMAFAKGRTDDALRIYHSRGNIDWISGRKATLDALADRYVEDMVADRANRSQGPSPTCLAITSRNAEVVDLNVAIRTRMQSAGLLSSEEIEVGVALRLGGRNKRKRAGTLKLALGDRVVFGETVVLAERIIRNADVANIVALEGHPLLVTFEFVADGSRITRRIEDLVGLREQHDPRLPLLRHAYASTVHFSQGLTVDRAYIASVHAMSREAMYVAMTRHRHVAQLFVDTTRLKASDLTGLPHALLAVLSKRQHKRTKREAQLESKRQAFFKECLRPDSKANASDFLANLDSALEDRPIATGSTLSRFQEIKLDTLAQMTSRSNAGFEEAARFEPLSRPNWTSAVGTYLRGQIVKAAERIAAAISGRQSRFHTSGRFRLRSAPRSPSQRDIGLNSNSRSASAKPPEVGEPP